MNRESPETLIGRETELVLVGALLDDDPGADRALLVSAEAGLGKTALLNTAAADAAASGARILRAEGVEFEAEVSFAGLNQALIPLIEEFGQLGELHRAALQAALGLAEGPPPDRLVVSNATLALLRQAAEHDPLLLVVDDLPWLDRSSAAVLGFVARRLTGSRVGLLAAARSDAKTFFDGTALPVLRMHPLTPDAASALLRRRYPMLAPGVRKRLLDVARGNPLALLELPAALTGRQREALQSLPTVLPLSGRLRALFEARVEGLTDAARNLLLLAALDGTGELAILQRASDDVELSGLGPAERAGLVQIEEDTHRLTFRHPLVRSAIVEVSTRNERYRAHRLLAGVLDAQPDRRAWHLAESTTGTDETVAGLLEQTARRVLGRGDPNGAVVRLTRAAELSPSAMDHRRRLVEAAYIAANMGSGLEDVARWLGEPTQGELDPLQSLQEATTGVLLLLNHEGHVAAAHRLMTAAIDGCGTTLDAEDDRVLAAVFVLLLICGYSGRADHAEQLYRVLDRLGPAPPEDLDLVARVFLDPVRTAPAILDRFDAALRSLDHEPDPWRIRRLALAAGVLDRLTPYRTALLRVVDQSREAGAVTNFVALLMHICGDDVQTGRWDELDKLLDECLQLCDARGLGLYVPIFQFRKGLLTAARGEEPAVHLANEMMRWAVARGADRIAAYAHHVLALSAIGRGDFETAFYHAAAISPPGTMAPYVHEAPNVCLDLVESAVRTHRHTEAASHVAVLLDLEVDRLSPRIAMLVHASAGLAADSDEVALEQFRQALDVADSARWPFDRARVRLVYGERLRRAHATGEARAELTAALDTFSRLRAEPWVTRATNEIRATGRTVPAGPATDRPVLTAQEHEIAVLAAAGLTNKQIGEQLFLSHRTVSTHLYRIFPKLGVATRGALRDALAEADPSPDPSGQPPPAAPKQQP
ncbi:AAA family ATPase [Kribbella sp. NPDC058693]|uniref:helix-turn-helix transcriptional regulator n=1 Tax=Kribbella sp. NPDC058693 TaxID=3346602 RepID=UPI00365AB3F0